MQPELPLAALSIISIAAIVQFICFIIVLIQLFKAKGAGLGILGIFCGIFPFIWGWIESGRLGLKKTMLIWTLSMVGMMVGYGIAIPAMMKAAGQMQDAASSPDMQQAIEQAQQAIQQAEQAAQQAAQPATPPVAPPQQ